MFEDLTIAETGYVYVPSGMIIRCRGTFTVRGTIYVEPAVMGGKLEAITGDSPGVVPGYRSPDPGWSFAPPGSGEFGDATETRAGGDAGWRMDGASARYLLQPGTKGGGGGMGVVDDRGGLGGGSLVVLAQDGVVIDSLGRILARGTRGRDGCGGGAGGIVILASPTTITFAGLIDVAAGDGGASDNRAGGGGGGGGGLVHLLSPSINDAGSVLYLDAGDAGAAGEAGSVAWVPRQGGGGGGACAGSGGRGGAVNEAGDPLPAMAGFSGLYLTTLADPTPLF